MQTRTEIKDKRGCFLVYIGRALMSARCPLVSARKGCHVGRFYVRGFVIYQYHRVYKPTIWKLCTSRELCMSSDIYMSARYPRTKLHLYFFFANFYRSIWLLILSWYFCVLWSLNRKKNSFAIGTPILIFLYFRYFFRKNGNNLIIVV